MVLVCVLRSLGGHETDLWRHFVSFGHSLTDCGLSALSEGFGMNIFGNQPWNMTIITRNVLLAHLVLMTANPSCCIATAVTEHIFVWLVFICHVL